MTDPTLNDCINYMKQQLKGMEKYPKSYEFNIPYYRKTIEFLEEVRPHGAWVEGETMTGAKVCVCSTCKSIFDDYIDKSKPCPNCGRTMRKEGDSDA